MVLFLKGGLGQRKLSIFDSSFIFLLSLELSSLLSLSHNSQVDFSLFWINQCLVCLFDCMPGILRPRVLTLVRVNNNCKSLVLFFDFFFSGSGIELKHIIWVVKLLVGESLQFYLWLESLGFNRLVFDSIDFLAIFVDCLSYFVVLLHSLI